MTRMIQLARWTLFAALPIAVLQFLSADGRLVSPGSKGHANLPGPAEAAVALPPGLADPDNLLSTVAEVSGTVAAILGGFVLSVLLARSSERGRLEALRKEISLTQAHLANKLRAAEEQRDDLLRSQLASWLRLVYRLHEDVPEVEEVERRIIGLGLGLPRDLVADVAHRYVSRRSAADAAVERSYDDLLQDRGLRSFPRWLLLYAGSADIDLLSDAFERAIGSIERFEGLAVPSHATRIPWRESDRLDSEALTAADLAIRNWHSSVMPRTVAELQNDCDRAGANHREVVAQLTEGTFPASLGLGFIIFCVIVVIGVLFPIWLIPTGGSITRIDELTVKVGLAVQVLLVSVYILILGRAGGNRSARRGRQNGAPEPHDAVA